MAFQTALRQTMLCRFMFLLPVQRHRVVQSLSEVDHLRVGPKHTQPWTASWFTTHGQPLDYPPPPETRVHVCAGDQRESRCKSVHLSVSLLTESLWLKVQFIFCIPFCTFRYLLYFTVSLCLLSAAGVILSYCWWKPKYLLIFLRLDNKWQGTFRVNIW